MRQNYKRRYYIISLQVKFHHNPLYNGNLQELFNQICDQIKVFFKNEVTEITWI